MDITGTSDPYCIMSASHTVIRTCTIWKNNKNPLWNEQYFMYLLSPILSLFLSSPLSYPLLSCKKKLKFFYCESPIEDPAKDLLTITVYDEDKVGKDGLFSLPVLVPLFLLFFLTFLKKT